MTKLQETTLDLKLSDADSSEKHMLDKREQPVTFTVTQTNYVSRRGETNFIVAFTGPMGSGKITVPGKPDAESDLNLLRQIVAVKKDIGNNKLYRTLDYMDHWRRGCVIRHRQWSNGEVAPALRGEARPEPKPLPNVAHRLLNHHDAKMQGWAVFNGGPHLCVEAPNGNFTISVNTLEGKKITFAFVPYHENGPAQCVDVQHHTSGVDMKNGDTDCPVQQVICFTVGSDLYRSPLTEEKGKGCTLMTVLLNRKEEG